MDIQTVLTEDLFEFPFIVRKVLLWPNSVTIGARKNHSRPAYSSGETINNDGYLLFKNITLKDIGYYIVVACIKNFKKK